MEFFLTTVLKLIPFLRVTILIAFTSMALGLSSVHCWRQ